MNNLRKYIWSVVLAATLCTGATYAYEVNVKSYEHCFDEYLHLMNKLGLEDRLSEAFWTIYNGLKNGQEVFDHELIGKVVEGMRLQGLQVSH